MLTPPPPDLHLQVGPGQHASQRNRATGFLRALHSTPLQSFVSSLRPEGVQLQRLFHVDGVQVEENQRAHIPGGQS